MLVKKKKLLTTGKSFVHTVEALELITLKMYRLVLDVKVKVSQYKNNKLLLDSYSSFNNIVTTATVLVKQLDQLATYVKAKNSLIVSICSLSLSKKAQLMAIRSHINPLQTNTSM